MRLAQILRGFFLPLSKFISLKPFSLKFENPITTASLTFHYHKYCASFLSWKTLSTASPSFLCFDPFGIWWLLCKQHRSSA